jgi:hypothetical protein
VFPDYEHNNMQQCQNNHFIQTIDLMFLCFPCDYSVSEMDETEFTKYHSSVKRGDIVGICGYPGIIGIH